jgi:Xaa-Pro aminopeptidase
MFGDGTTALAKHLRGYGAARLGYERGWLPAGFTTGDLIDLNPALMAMRRRKDDDELALIREAIRVTEAGHRAARAFLRPGVTEIEVYNTINSAINQEFGHPVHLMGDFVGGGRVKSGGGFPSNLALRAGDVMILDVFPIVNGYRADFTATVAVTPDVTPAQRRLDDALHEAQAAGAALLKPGAIAGDVYRAVRKPLEARGFAPHFPHHAGHGLGLDHPEAPYFVPQSEEVLVEGDVVTLEPGAYGNDYGARIEHIYRITADGSERLTAHDTRLG